MSLICVMHITMLCGFLCNQSVFFYTMQEEIRFMINPELIVGMLFMASMDDNEAIEIVGAERFSQYMGLV